MVVLVNTNDKKVLLVAEMKVIPAYLILKVCK